MGTKFLKFFLFILVVFFFVKIGAGLVYGAKELAQYGPPPPPPGGGTPAPTPCVPTLTCTACGLPCFQNFGTQQCYDGCGVYLGPNACVNSACVAPPVCNSSCIGGSWSYACSNGCHYATCNITNSAGSCSWTDPFCYADSGKYSYTCGCTSAQGPPGHIAQFNCNTSIGGPAAWNPPTWQDPNCYQNTYSNTPSGSCSYSCTCTTGTGGAGHYSTCTDQSPAQCGPYLDPMCYGDTATVQCSNGQQATTSQCIVTDRGNQWAVTNQVCVTNGTCATPVPTPTPTATPTPKCTTGSNGNSKDCASCGAACGTALADCQFTQPQPCIRTQAPGVGCGNCPSQAQSCVANRCVNNATIMGDVFVDTNVDTLKDNGEGNYGGAITITATDPTGVIKTATVVGGSYSLSLAPNTSYRVTYTNPPTGQGYYVTYPTTAGNPFFDVALGTPCSTGGSNSAICDGAGNINTLNFGITNTKPWFQCQGGDCRIDAGFTDKIPSTSLTLPYANLNGSGGTPGLIFTGNSTPDFGFGQASTKGWVVGGAGALGETYAPTKIGGVVKTSYNYILSKVNQGNITPTDLSTVCNLQSCVLPSLAHGIYKAGSSVNLVGASPFSGGSYVILVNGDLTISTRISVPAGSTALFTASGNINVDKSIGEAASSSSPTIEGIYSADKSFNAQSFGGCTIQPDLRLNIGGSVITNAAGLGGSFQNSRDLCANDPSYPALSFFERVDFIINTPEFLKNPNFTYQEVAP